MGNDTRNTSDFDYLELDPSFGNQGKVTFPGIKGQCRAMVEDAVGRLIVGIWTNPDIELFRLSPDGAIDRDFGMNGSVLVQFESGFDSFIDQILIQPDGKILVAGRRRQFDDYVGLPALARLMEDGRLDPGFGTDGKVVIKVDNKDLNLTVSGCSLLLGPAGQLFMTFPYNVINADRIGITTTLLLKLDSVDGHLLNQQPIQHLGLSTYLSSLTLTPNNKMLLFGNTMEPIAGQGITRILLTRHDLEGWKDYSFGERGWMWFGPETGNYSTSAPLLLDDFQSASYKIMVLGSDVWQALAMRFTTDGQPDKDFNNGQPSVIELSDWLNWSSGIPLKNGKMLVAGWIRGVGITTEFCIAQLLENGSLDESFSKNGLKLGPDFTRFWQMILQDDGVVTAADSTADGNVPHLFRFRLK